MKVAVYLRVSTRSQTVDNQRSDIESWLATHHVTTESVSYYQENESAWKLNHQHELARLMADIRTGRKHFDYLLIWAMDRLSRQGIGPTFQIINELRSHGCILVSCQEPYLESSPDVVAAFVADIARMQSQHKSAQVKAGQARARRQGKHIGRPKGKKDSKRRRKVGYLLRWERKKVSAQTGA